MNFVILEALGGHFSHLEDFRTFKGFLCFLEHACPDGLQMQCPELQCLRLAQFFRELTSDQVIRFFGDNDNIEDFLQTVDKWLEEESRTECVLFS